METRNPHQREFAIQPSSHTVLSRDSSHSHLPKRKSIHSSREISNSSELEFTPTPGRRKSQDNTESEISPGKRKSIQISREIAENEAASGSGATRRKSGSEGKSEISPRVMDRDISPNRQHTLIRKRSTDAKMEISSVADPAPAIPLPDDDNTSPTKLVADDSEQTPPRARKPSGAEPITNGEVDMSSSHGIPRRRKSLTRLPFSLPRDGNTATSGENSEISPRALPETETPTKRRSPSLKKRRSQTKLSLSLSSRDANAGTSGENSEVSPPETEGLTKASSRKRLVIDDQVSVGGLESDLSSSPIVRHNSRRKESKSASNLKMIFGDRAESEAQSATSARSSSASKKKNKTEGTLQISWEFSICPFLCPILTGQDQTSDHHHSHIGDHLTPSHPPKHASPLRTPEVVKDRSHGLELLEALTIEISKLKDLKSSLQFKTFVRLLNQLDQDFINHPNRKGRTLLYCASAAGQFPFVCELLKVPSASSLPQQQLSHLHTIPSATNFGMWRRSPVS